MQNDRGAIPAHRRDAESTAASAGRHWNCVPGLRVSRRRFGFEVVGEACNMVDEGSRCIERGRAQALPGAEFRNIGIKETAYFNHRIAVVISGDVERHEDGVVVRALDRLRDGCIGICGQTEINVSKKDAIISEFPGNHAICQLAAAIPHASRGFRDLRIP